MGLTQICQNPAHLGLSFGVLNAKGSSSSQLHSCEPPRAIPYEVAASGLGPVKPLLGLIGDASPGSIPQGMLTVPLVLKPSPI